MEGLFVKGVARGWIPVANSSNPAADKTKPRFYQGPKGLAQRRLEGGKAVRVAAIRVNAGFGLQTRTSDELEYPTDHRQARSGISRA
jgi:hypothetical protein